MERKEFSSLLPSTAHIFTNVIVFATSHLYPKDLFVVPVIIHPPYFVFGVYTHPMLAHATVLPRLHSCRALFIYHPFFFDMSVTELTSLTLLRQLSVLAVSNEFCDSSFIVREALPNIVRHAFNLVFSPCSRRLTPPG